MDNAKRKPIIGIVGGVGSGKSAVAGEFAKLGCSVIDADKIAHELLNKLVVKEEIVGVFGAVLDSTGKIDRKKLADIVFADAQKLSLLNRIIHPLVLERAEELIRRYNRQRQVRAIVLDMPLLVEIGWDKRCERIVFVDCQKQKRMDRVKNSGIFDENQLKIRENFQISLDKKKRIADNVIDNNSEFSALFKQVANIFSQVISSWGLAQN